MEAAKGYRKKYEKTAWKLDSETFVHLRSRKKQTFFTINSHGYRFEIHIHDFSGYHKQEIIDKNTGYYYVRHYALVSPLS